MPSEMKEYIYRYKVAATAIVCACIIALTLFGIQFKAPSSFVPQTIVTIDSGSTVDQAAQLLESKSVIRSPKVFEALVRIFASRKGIQSGDYLFASKESVVTVVFRLVTGNYALTSVKVTIPEGFDSGQIATLLSTDLIHFDSASFLALARPHEGYLFPDTYFLSPVATPESIVAAMSANFDTRIATVTPEITAFGRPLSQVIIMASIVEEEAKPETDPVDAQKIAGILWKRLDAGQALEVDSPFRYAIGKTTATLTSEDLATTSPYNTYINKGLPPTPITNPGIAAILATVTPIATPYWFFLTGDDGKMHYATTFAEHENNKALYLQ